MRKKKVLRLVILVILLVLLIWQFIPVDRSVPEYDKSQDFFALVQADDDIRSLIKDACYECHSYESEYPWYAYVAPVAGWIQGHIDHGRDECNFSEWGTFSAQKADHKLEECADLIREGKMPLPSFTRFGMHPEAKLSDDQRRELAAFFEGLRE